MAGTQKDLVSTSTDVVLLTDMDQQQLKGLGDMLLSKERTAPDVVREPEDVSREIIAQILAATSVDEIERQEAEGWAEYEGVPMEVRSIAWRPSTYEEGHAIFFVVRANDLSVDPPAARVLTTGAGNVMAQLIALAGLGALVGAIREYTTDETAQGFKVGFLRTPEGLSPTGHLQAATAEAGA